MRLAATLALAVVLGAATNAAADEPRMTKAQVVEAANEHCRTGGERVRHWRRLGWRAAKNRRRPLALQRYRRSLRHRDRIQSRLENLRPPERGQGTWREFLRNSRKLNEEHRERVRQYADGAHRNVFLFFRLTALNYQRVALAAAAEYGLGEACAKLLRK
jgi:hypothetical protein